jgi:hypothetical protein
MNVLGVEMNGTRLGADVHGHAVFQHKRSAAWPCPRHKPSVARHGVKVSYCVELMSQVAKLFSMEFVK